MTYGIDSGAARKHFSRAARTYAGASRLEAEVASRMLERLDLVKLSPRRVLDAGSGPPQRALVKRYPAAPVIAPDFAVEMLRASRFGWFRKKPLPLCGDLSKRPLADGSVDLAWSNMALHWMAEPLAALRELHRVLGADGLLMFSTLGPDTLKELRAAAGASRVHRFADMHDLGDALLAAGFSAPVMDMELLTLQYADTGALLADLRASGQTLARADRPRGLAGRGLRAALGRAGSAATYEVVYGHAWKGVPRKTADGRSIVQVNRLPR